MVESGWRPSEPEVTVGSSVTAGMLINGVFSEFPGGPSGDSGGESGACSVLSSSPSTCDGSTIGSRVNNTVVSVLVSGLLAVVEVRVSPETDWSIVELRLETTPELLDDTNVVPDDPVDVAVIVERELVAIAQAQVGKDAYG